MITVAPSEWGFTATLSNGIAIAHSKDRRLLDEYLAECLGDPAPRQESSVDRGVPASGDLVSGAGARGGSSASVGGTAPAGAPLTEITYTTRARSTGATASAGKTSSGFGMACLSHGNLASAKSRTEAETRVSKPQEWCDGCAPIAAGDEPKIKKNALLEELL